nr:PREDICTED: checkpoint protein HUS1 [Struthio camelus australis]
MEGGSAQTPWGAEVKARERSVSEGEDLLHSQPENPDRTPRWQGRLLSVRQPGQARGRATRSHPSDWVARFLVYGRCFCAVTQDHCSEPLLSLVPYPLRDLMHVGRGKGSSCCLRASALVGSIPICHSAWLLGTGSMGLLAKVGASSITPALADLVFAPLGPCLSRRRLGDALGGFVRSLEIDEAALVEATQRGDADKRPRTALGNRLCKCHCFQRLQESRRAKGLDLLLQVTAVLPFAPAGVVNTVARLAKSCTLRLTADRLYFILSDKVANGGVSVWCELCQGNFFDEFQMEGVAAEHNEIYLELVPENLSRALKTAQNAKTVKIKLTNKHCPCLTVAVELPTLSSSSRIVTHDIPVGVIPRRLWNDFREPSVPDFDVSIYLPALKTMKSVVERMKNLSNCIVIEANLSGEMNLKIETDLVSVTTHFKDLGNPPWASDDECQSSAQDRDLESMAEARIDIKKLLQLLAGQQVNPTKALCNITAGLLSSTA